MEALMGRKSGIAVAWAFIVVGAACQREPVVGEDPTDTGSSTTTAVATTTTGTPPDTTTTGATTTGATTTGVDSTSTGGSTAVGSETAGFVFDVGGGMATGNIPDLPPVLDYDCDDLTVPFITEMELASPRGYHDVYFDQDGHIIGWDGNSLLQVTYDNDVDVFLPGINSAQGMDVLENGDLLYVNDFGELRRVTPDPQSTTVATGLSGAYGITVGPDQMAYVCTSNNIRRVDPDTGDQDVWLTLPGSDHPRAMVFNLDSTGAYISTLVFGNSPVYFVELDEDLDPTGPAVIFATNVGQGYHDGLGIDACGNLYVPDYNTSGLYRIDPEGVVTTLYNEGTASFNHYGHGLEWGSGIDGWNDHAIYLPQPYDGHTVNEIDLGVPSGSTVRTWR
jgi:hypothetical protein